METIGIFGHLRYNESVIGGVKMKLKTLTAMLVAGLAVIVSPIIVKAATSFDGMLNNGVITLTEDVTLSEKYVIPEGENITIDLNGHKITGPSDNYAIENKGTLKIVDSGIVKGKIACTSASSSCVRNLGNLELSGVTAEGPFVVIKNDAEGNFYGNLTVENSTLTSSYTKTDTGTIMNWGTAMVTNSRVNASVSGIAIYATSGAEAGKNSEITLNANILEGKYSIYSRNYQSSDGTTQTINVQGGQLIGSISAMASRGSDVSIKGKVATTDAYLNTVLSFADESAEIILTTDLTNKKITVPEGVTLTIPENVTFTVSSARQLIVNGKLDVQGTLDAAAFVEETNTYFGTLANAIKLIGDGHNVVVLKDITETTITPYANKNITVDLNGHNVTADITVPATTEMTFKDSSEKTTGTYNGTITNEGTLTIESGNYTKVPVTKDGATTTLNGGTYPIEDMENVIIPADKEIVANEDGTYSIVSKVTDEENVNGNTGNTNNADQNENVTNPSTSDNIVIYIAMALLAIGGMIATGMKLKRNNA